MTLNWNELWDEDEQRYRVQLLNGDAAHVHTINGKNPRYPVVGERLDQYGNWQACSWGLDGEYVEQTHYRNWNLIPEPRTVRRWVNVCRTSTGYRFVGPFALEATARIAQDKTPQHGYLDTIQVEWKE